MSVIERVQILAKEFGGIEKFCETCGINPYSLRSAIRRNSELKTDVLTSIIEAFPKLSLHWLLLGEGAMWNENDQTINQLMEERAQYVTRLNELLERRIKELERELKRTDPDKARELGID